MLRHVLMHVLVHAHGRKTLLLCLLFEGLMAV